MGGTKSNNTPAFQPEILDLTNLTAGWSLLAPHQAPREYHSFALLLLDGRVLHGGGQRSSTGPYYHAEIFSPPNLFAGPRPVIQTAALDAQYGSTFTVNMAVIPPGGVSFELIRPGSMTHSTDFDQRLVEVSSTPAGGSSFTVTAPTGPDIAPPGWYMLFAVSSLGVPSVATFMRIHP